MRADGNLHIDKLAEAKSDLGCLIAMGDTDSYLKQAWANIGKEDVDCVVADFERYESSDGAMEGVGYRAMRLLAKMKKDDFESAHNDLLFLKENSTHDWSELERLLKRRIKKQASLHRKKEKAEKKKRRKSKNKQRRHQGRI